MEIREEEKIISLEKRRAAKPAPNPILKAEYRDPLPEEKSSMGEERGEEEKK